MAYEDFTTFTKIGDTNNRYTVSQYTITGTSVPATDTTKIYKDYGSNYFTTFRHDVDFYVSSTTGNMAVGSSYLVSNEVNTIYSLEVNSKDCYIAFWYRSMAGIRRIYFENPSTGDQSYSPVNEPIYLYVTMDVNTTAKLYIYSDSARTNLLGTLTVPKGSASGYRYAMICSDGHPSSNAQTTFTVSNLELNAGQPPSETALPVKIRTASATITLVEDATSKLKIRTPAGTKGIKLVPTNDANASPIRIYDGTSVKALKKYTGS